MDTKKHLQVVLTIITRGEDACSRKCPFMTVGSPDYYCILFDQELVFDPNPLYNEKSSLIARANEARITAAMGSESGMQFEQIRVYRSENCVSSNCVDTPDKDV